MRWIRDCGLLHFRVRRATKRCFERRWTSNGENFGTENAILVVVLRSRSVKCSCRRKIAPVRRVDTFTK
ncbi:hypothetical protein L596_025745 [Steinernema carpocapsae]|uniref:Uncharacterized protein n=1 Tax=Steinernema carpocapsae TaxID=34508 RepID=A0A4U5M8P9_STECR|nr:hypothetical protein L596_025745 [Steinernema carpocapsae]